MAFYKGGRTHEESRQLQRDRIAAFKASPKIKSPISTRHVGHAGELLVCFDFVSRGYDAVVNHMPGAPFDVIASVSGDLVRIEVKTLFWPRTKIRKDRTARESRLVARYDFGGGGGKQKSGQGASYVRRLTDYKLRGVDLIALVALDKRDVLYIPAKEIKATVRVSASAFAKRAEGSLDRFLFDRVLM